MMSFLKCPKWKRANSSEKFKWREAKFSIFKFRFAWKRYSKKRKKQYAEKQRKIITKRVENIYDRSILSLRLVTKFKLDRGICFSKFFKNFFNLFFFKEALLPFLKSMLHNIPSKKWKEPLTHFIWSSLNITIFYKVLQFVYKQISQDFYWAFENWNLGPFFK